MNKNLLHGLLLAVSALAYTFLGYLLEREEFAWLFSVYSFVFAGFLILYSSDNQYKFQIGLFFRIIFLLSIPNLSQDYIRFIWDGRLLLQGINPYLHTPIELVKLPQFTLFQSNYLIEQMGSLSANNHSNYPPFNQGLFLLASFFSPKSILGNIIGLRFLIILADIGIYHYGRKLLEKLNLPKNNIHFYFLNPLIIIELTGNLHFEGVMMFFFCVGLFYYLKDRLTIAGVLIGAAILVKLIPLMLLPFFFKKDKFKEMTILNGVIAFTIILAFLPFLDKGFLNNYAQTLGLWFTKFEFNASIYYFFRKIGFWLLDYNAIGILGKIPPILIVIVSIYRAMIKPHLFNNSFFILMLYFLLATTVHPWYLTSLIFLGVFANKYSIWVWSFTVILSYAAYRFKEVQENPVFLFMEYGLVIFLFCFETFKNKKFERIRS
jgi:alpha-1,6-mannosyltransferase